MTSQPEKPAKTPEERWIDGWSRGPTRLRWSRMPLQVGDTAPDYALKDSRGEEVRLSSSWGGSPGLLLFWRQYGCGCGIDRAGRLVREYDSYVQAGANVMIVGQGEPDRAAAYAAKYSLPPILILCDPQFVVYEAYGLVEGKPSQVMFDAPEPFLDRDFDAGVELAQERRALGRPLVDNGWLLPGEFVIDQSGVVRLAYRYNYCEDFPDPRVLVAAIREARLDRP